MAKDIAIGKALEIPQNVLNRLDEVDKKINAIASDSEKMATHFTSAMTRMGSSTNDLISKLSLIQNAVKNISNINANGLNNIANGMGKTATEAEKAANSITKAAVAANKMGSGMNIAEITQEIKSINQLLTKGRGADTIFEQQQLVDRKRLLEEELKIQNQSQTQKEKIAQKNIELAKKEQIANENAYNKFIQDLDRKEQAEKRAAEKEEQLSKKRIESRKKDVEYAIAQKEKEIKAEEEYNRKKQANLEKEVALLERQQAARAKSTNLEKETLNWVLSQKEKQTKAEQEAAAISEKYAKLEQQRVEAIAKAEDDRRKAKKAYYEESLRYAEQLNRKEEQAAKELEKSLKAQAKLESNLRKSAYQSYIATPEGALRTADKANTYTARAQAIKNLEAAIKRLRTTDENYQRNLNKLSEAHKRLSAEQRKVESNYRSMQTSHSRLIDTSDQLARKIALIFSVSQVQGYLVNIAKVTGEFEKQNVALASILQNKDQADILFSRITELAVKSPFTLKELTTYTKSLSAYQVEYEKLYDTTKMLADVSAGLGVDMQRLILAFGQVKSANYLRGTETRQFTEAGFNILGELAKYYTEIEGRAVSLGEVQERQFKRMIAFADVEEVFKRATSAGGMFYQMQERQAETIAGQWSNLEDSIDIMLNSIGQANDGIIRDSLTAVKSLVENWEDFATGLKFLSPVLALVLLSINASRIATGGFSKAITTMAKNSSIAGKSIDSLSVKITNLSSRLKGGAVLANGLKGALSGLAAIGVGAAIAAIATGITYLYVEMTRASREAEKLNNKLEEILYEGQYNASKMSAQFKVLAETVLDSAKSTEEQNKALEELKRKYGEILPSYTLTIKGLKELKGNYDDVTAAIYAKIEAQTKEKQIRAVGDTYGEQVEKSYNRLKNILVKQYKLLPEDATATIEALRAAINDGTIKINDDYTKFVEQFIKTNYNLNLDLSKTWKTLTGTNFFGKDKFKIVEMESQNDAIKELAESVFAYKDAVEEISSADISGLGKTSAYRALENNIKGLEDEITAAKKRIAEQGKGKSEFFISEAQIAKEKEILNKWVADFQSGAIKIRDSYGNLVTPDSQSALKFLEEINDRMNNIDGNAMQTEVRNTIREFSKLNDISLVNLDKVLMTSAQSMSEYADKVKASIKDITERLAQYEAGATGYLTQIFTKQDLEREKQTKALLEFIQSSLTPDIGTEKERENAAKKAAKEKLDQLNEQIRLVKEAQSEYKKLREYESEASATELVKDMFKDTSVGNIVAEMTFDPQGIIDGLNQIVNKAGEEGEKALEKATRPLEREIVVDAKVKNLEDINKDIDDAFASYELSMELKDTGIGDSLIKDLFDIDVISLDDLKKKIEELKPTLSQQGTEYEKVWKESLKRITKYEADQLQKRLKNYAQYLQAAISKRAKLELDLQKEIADIQKTEELSDSQKNTLIKGKREETIKLKAELDWEEFKSSDVYTKMFEDLEFVSTAALQKLKDNLDMVKGSMKNLNPEQVKAIQEAYSKIEEQLISRNPFKEMRDAMKEVSELQARGRTEDVLQQELLMYEASANSLKSQISDLEIIIGLKDRGMTLDNLDKDFLERNKGLLNQSADSLRDLVQLKKLSLKGTEGNIGITYEDLNSYETARKSLSAMGNEFDAIISLTKNAYGSIVSVLEAVGVESDSIGMTFADMGMSMIDLIGQAVMFGLQLKLLTATATALGVAINTALGPIGWAVMAIQGIATAITAIFSAGDKRKEKEIERQIELIENLQKAYEKLEEAIDNAYSIDTLKASTDQAIANLQAQNEALQKSIAAEEDKKKTDDSRIQEWKDAYEENVERIKELEQEELIALGGLGTAENMKSAAENFVDAWYEAFKETGNGLTGLEEQFETFFDDMMKKQLLMRGAENYLKGFYEQFDSMFTDGMVDKSELENIKNQWGITSEGLNAFLESLANSLGVIGGEAKDTMSGLSESISGISEEQADVLAAITESIRYYSADSNTVLRNIYNWIMNPPMENPLFSEIRTQTELLRSMNSLLSSFGKTKSGISGKVLKVELV